MLYRLHLECLGQYPVVGARVGAPKSGTTHFHGYATVSILRDNRRYVVALRFIEYGEEMADIIRLLLVGLAFVLFNLYIALRQNLLSVLKRPVKSPKRFWLSLLRLALMLGRAIERLWGIAVVLQHQPCFVLS